MRHKELLALGVFGPKSRIGDRIEMLLKRGRTFSPRASMGRVVASAVVLLGFLIAGSLAPRWIAFAQQEPRPSFEVAAIKPCKVVGSMETRWGDSSPGRLSTGCDHLVDEDNYFGLIHRAYVTFAGGHSNPLRIVPIEGGPKWIHSDGYKIDAAAEGSPSLQMTQGPMLQALLEDRFKLKIHPTTRIGPVYSLTVVKSGSKLKPFLEGSCINVASLPGSKPVPGQRYCDDIISARNPASINAEGITLGQFSQMLDLVLDRHVIDNTGLTGKYDFHLSFSRDQSTSRLPPLLGASAAPSDVTGQSIFSAIQEQLGLKLVAANGPIQVLVIDHIERPSEN